MSSAFQYVKDKGIVTEGEYPYRPIQGTCSIIGGPFTISGYTNITNCNDLSAAIAGKPVSVAVDATNWSSYKSGVFSNCATRLNHGVTLVGVAQENWVIKNSWGTSWG
jgi:C1A family cysteine protease